MPHAVQHVTEPGPNWLTPGSLASEIIARYSLDFDAFADHENSLAPTYSTEDGTYRRCPADWPPHTKHETPLSDIRGAWAYGPGVPEGERCPGYVKIGDGDGFSGSWAGLRVFLNPPYARGFFPRVVEKCAAEAAGRVAIPDDPEYRCYSAARIVVGLFLCDTSTIAWREGVLANAESIEYLPRVQYELPPADLATWREGQIEREIEKARKEGIADATAVADIRSAIAAKVPGSPNFGSAVVVFKGPRYTVRG